MGKTIKIYSCGHHCSEIFPGGSILTENIEWVDGNCQWCIEDQEARNLDAERRIQEEHIAIVDGQRFFHLQPWVQS